MVCPPVSDNGAFGKIRATFFLAQLVSMEAIRSSVNLGPLFCFFSVWGLVVRKECFRLNPRVLFPRDFIRREW